MKRPLAITLVIAASLLCSAVHSQDQAAGQQRAAALKQSLAENRAKLQKYQWVETTTVSMKGDVKKQEQQQCYYGSDGKVQKTPIGGSPAAAPPPAPERGLRGRIVAKKVAEVKDDMEALKELVGQYVPPDPQRLKQTAQAGKTQPEAPDANGIASVTFNDYAKSGDKVIFSFDSATRKIRSFTVNTYQDNPKDVVTLAVNFSSLDDGTNYVQQTVLESKSKEVKVTTANSGYKSR